MNFRLWLRLLLRVLRAVHIPEGVGASSPGTNSNRPIGGDTEKHIHYSISHIVNGAISNNIKEERAQCESTHT